MPSLLLTVSLVVAAPAETELIGLGSECHYLVPSEENGGSALATAEWTAGPQDFDDSMWPLGQLGIGYGSDAEPWLEFFYWDVFDVMRFINASIYLRASFDLTAAEVAEFKQLVLGVRVDDGFVAFLNGTEVVRFNAPDELEWDSESEAVHPDSSAAEPLPFDLTGHLELLVEGRNVLAIQLLNNTPNSQDIFILPELWANELEPGSIAHPKHLSVLSIDRREDGFPSAMTVGVAQGRIYQLQSSSDMEHWSNRGNQVLARGTTISFPITGTFFFTPRFYRVVELGD